MSLKLNNGKINKKIRMVDTFDELLKQSAASFPELDPTSITFFYVDEDSDKITVESDFDLKECKDYLNSVGGKSIKLFIEPKEKKAVVNSQFIQENLDNNISYFSEKNGVFEIQNSINQSIVIDEAVKNKRIEEENKKLEEINGKYNEAKEKTEQFIKQISEGDIFASFKAEMVNMLSGLESSKKEEKPYQPAVSEPNQPLTFEKQSETLVSPKNEVITCPMNRVYPKKRGQNKKNKKWDNISNNLLADQPSNCHWEQPNVCFKKRAEKKTDFPVIEEDEVPKRRTDCFDLPPFKYQTQLDKMNRIVSIPQNKQVKARNLLIAFNGDAEQALDSYMKGDEPAM